VHDDTDHQHIHIAINKIHPRKLTIHNPYYDYKKVATLCEQIEEEYGLTQVNHETKLDKSSRIIQDIETKAGIESLLGWIRRECLDDIGRANTWQGLHQLLQNHGLEIKERGNGLVFVSSHGVAVKASYVDRSLSKPNLIKRLGAFEAPAHTTQTTYAQSKQYQPRPLPNIIDTARLFERYQQQQADAASWRKEQWLTLREQRDRLIERAKKNAKRKRSILKQVQAGQLVKKALYATVSGQFKATLDDIKREYRAAYAQLKTSQRRMAWLDWLTVEAKNGNAEALSALRARSKKDSRIAGNHLSGNPYQNNQSRNDTVESVTKDGTVIYRIGNAAIRDDGKRLFVSPNVLNDSLADVLQVAIDKYGNHLSVNGSDNFRMSVVQAAVQNSLRVTFDDKTLEHYRQQLLKQRIVSQPQRFAEIQAKTNTTKARRNSL
jgi:hypothetical protein